MQRIEVKNFGPLKDVSIDITNIVVLIGESASGKSTLAKLVYFFNTLKDEIYSYIRFNREKYIHFTLTNFHIFLIHEIIDKYVERFGENMVLGSSVTATFGKRINGKLENSFTITINAIKDENLNQTEFQFPDLAICVKSIVEKNELTMRNLYEYQSKNDIRAVEYFEELLKNSINDSFYDNTDSLYIPASRTFSVSLNDSMKLSIYASLVDITKSIRPTNNPEYGNLDNIIIKEFITYSSKLKDRLKNVTFEQYHFNVSNSLEVNTLSEELTYDVLNGKYSNDGENEYIVIENDIRIPIEIASSGQQEVLRILQEINVSRIDGKYRFRVIEEPETHLFPIAQKKLVELITLLSNVTSNNNDDENSSKILITTHSPYILASFNNLMYACKVGIENEKINSSLWISQDQIRAYKLKGGFVEDIIDYELGLIKNEEIDEASRIINEEFDFIDNLQ